MDWKYFTSIILQKVAIWVGVEVKGKELKKFTLIKLLVDAFSPVNTKDYIRAEKLQPFSHLFCTRVIKPKHSLKSTKLVSTQI